MTLFKNLKSAVALLLLCVASCSILFCIKASGAEQDAPATIDDLLDDLRKSAAESEPKSELEVDVKASDDVSTGMYIIIGPGKSVLPAGKYKIVFFPDDESLQVKVTVVRTDSGQGPVVITDPVVPPDPPKPTDARTAIAESLKKVDDVNKVKTAASIVTVLEELVKGAGDGKINRVQAIDSLTTLGTIASVGMPGWSSFISTATELVKKSQTISDVSDILKITIEELKKVK